jgi:hypothetical protein
MILTPAGPDDASSPIAIHLSQCIYARMWYEKLALVSNQQWFMNLHLIGRAGLRRLDPAWYEALCIEGQDMLAREDITNTTFTQPTCWPFKIAGSHDHGACVVPAMEEGQEDSYGDMLIHNDSQASWATARPCSVFDLFKRPLDMVELKRQRELRYIRKQRKEGVQRIWAGVLQGPRRFDDFTV